MNYRFSWRCISALMDGLHLHQVKLELKKQKPAGFSPKKPAGNVYFLE